MATEMFEVTDGKSDRAVIRVIGVGGGGCNTVNQMVESGIDGLIRTLEEKSRSPSRGGMG